MQTVTALITSPADGRFRVHLPSGVADFIDLEAAAAHAETHVTLLALDQARRAGADDPQIQVTRDDTIITERGGGSVFIESKITAVAVGRPRLARERLDRQGACFETPCFARLLPIETFAGIADFPTAEGFSGVSK